jgi:hypothetical protein
MSAVPYERHDEDWDTTEPAPSLTSRPPRRRFFNRRSAALAAAITCAAGFYAGIRVEKSQLSSSASAAATTAVAGARPGAAAGAAGTGAQTGAAVGGLAGRFGGGAGGGGGGGGQASIGTISSVNGNTIYLTDTTGNTVKVTLSGTTKLTKSLGVAKSALHPGDSVVIQGVKNSSGTLVATSVGDSGARTAGTGSSSSTPAAGG